jgi:hypothetical protein
VQVKELEEEKNRSWRGEEKQQREGETVENDDEKRKV